jgi:hypothetical protein
MHFTINAGAHRTPGLSESHTPLSSLQVIATESLGRPWTLLDGPGKTVLCLHNLKYVKIRLLRQLVSCFLSLNVILTYSKVSIILNIYVTKEYSIYCYYIFSLVFSKLGLISYLGLVGDNQPFVEK